MNTTPPSHISETPQLREVADQVDMVVNVPPADGAAASRLEIVPGERQGTTLYSYRGYLYHQNAAGNSDRPPARERGSVSCRCKRYRGCKSNGYRKCHARLVVTGNLDDVRLASATVKGSHTCGDPDAPSMKGYIEMKERAKKLSVRARVMEPFHEVTPSMDDAAVAGLPSRKAIHETLRKTKKTSLGLPTAPSSREGLAALPSAFVHVNAGGLSRSTLLFDSGEGDKDRLIIWMDPWVKDVMKNDGEGFHISVDGTFKTSPTHWAQQFTVMVRFDCGRMFLLFYAILPRKNGNTYERFFAAIEGSLTQDVGSCMMDFEYAVRKAFEGVFGKGKVVLCYFHFCQNIRRKFESLIRKPVASKEQQALREEVYYDILALPFLPLDLVDLGMDFICDKLSGDDRRFLLKYLRPYYGMKGIHPARLWNLRLRVEQELPRTNNGQEGFHNHWNGHFPGSSHPTIWSWISVVHDLMKETRAELLMMREGEIWPREARYLENDAILRRVCRFRVDSASLGSWFDKVRASIRRIVKDMRREVDEAESLEFPTIEPATDAKRKADFGPNYSGVNQRKRLAAVTLNDAVEFSQDSESSEPPNNDTVVLGVPEGSSLDDGLLRMFNEVAAAFAGNTLVENSLMEAPPMPAQAEAGSQGIAVQPPSQEKSGSDGTDRKSDKGRNSFPTWRIFPGREVGTTLLLTTQDRENLVVEDSSISDQVIEAWMTRIEHKFKRKVNRAQAPISDGGCHFTCTVRINGDIFYFDSSYGEQAKVSDYMKVRLRQLYGSGAKVVCPSVQQQTIGSNLCGAFVLARLTAYAASPHQKPDKFLFRESEMRQHIFSCLEDESRRSLLFPRIRGRTPPDVILSKKFSFTL